MPDDSQQQSKTKRANQNPTFWEWLIYGKGTASAPWPTIEEVLQEPTVQRDIKEVRDAFKNYQKYQNRRTENKKSV